MPSPGFEIDEPKKTILQKAGARFMGSDVTETSPTIEYTRLGSMIAGSIMGAKAFGAGGAAVGSPLGPIGAGVGAAGGALAGGVLGGSAGAMAPGVVMEMGEALGLLEPGTREGIDLSPDEMRKYLEGELYLELGTAGGIGLARLARRDISRMLTGITKKKAETAEEAARYGLNMLPVQVGDRTVARSFVSVFGRFPYVAGPIRNEMQKVDKALITAFDNLPTRIAIPASMNDVSARIFSDVKNLSNDIATQFDAEYEAIYKLADKQNISFKPQGTINKVQEIIADIALRTPPDAKAADSLIALRKFLVNKFPKDTGVVAKYTLRQMDALMETADEEIGQIARKGRSLPLQYVADLRVAIGMDMMTLGRGKMGPGGAGGGGAAADVGKKLQEVDERFTKTMSEVFENATANRFTTVQKRGVKGFKFEKKTQVQMDHLADILMRGDSVETITDLQRMLVNAPETMKMLAASIVQRNTDKAMEFADGAKKFNIESFADSMGITKGPRSPKFMQTAKLLEVAGGLNMGEVQKLVDWTRKVAEVPIPDVSAFIARRAGIGGLRGAVGPLIPGLAVAGGTAAGNARSWVSLAVGGGLLLAGGRSFAKAISDPLAARPLRYVLREETSRVGKKAALFEFLRVSIWAGVDAGEYTVGEGRERMEAARIYMDEVGKYMKENE